MGRAIAIVGAGQSGLQLALGLVKNNYAVTLIANRTAEQVLKGRILSTQVMFSPALYHERKIGIDFWQKRAPQNTSITFALSDPTTHKRGVYWKALTKPYQAVDQRVKFSTWLNEFQRLGGELIIDDIDIEKLNRLSKVYDLTIVAAGKGALSNAFARDSIRSRFEKPMRSLACAYVKGMEPKKENPGVRINIIPNVGEYFTVPGITTTGHCEMVLFEGIPGQALDCWSGIKTPEEFLQQIKYLLKTYVPWEAERCQNISLTDPLATLSGKMTPIIRQPVFKTTSEKPILGIADTLVLNDPIAGQGANNASFCAAIYLARILANGNKPFNEPWMRETFDLFWHQRGRSSTNLSNLLLLPPEPHIMKLLNDASDTPLLAKAIVAGFGEPNSLFPWMLDPKQAEYMTSLFKKEQEEQEATHANFRPRE